MKSSKAQHRAKRAAQACANFLHGLGATGIALRVGRKHNVLTYTLNGVTHEFAVPRKPSDVDYVRVLQRTIRRQNGEKN